MDLRIGIENNVEGRSLAWALDYPGLFAYGQTSDLALAAAPDACLEYADWISQRASGASWLDTESIELVLEDEWTVYTIDESYRKASQGYEVNAWFQSDWRPLSAQEVERGLKILDWSRVDLLDLARQLSPAQLNEAYLGERWTIDGILRHLGGAEWWYLDRLGESFPREQLPKDTFERLERVRARLIDVLLGLTEVRKVVGVDGEFWSPRKLLRRAAWHERDHFLHILRLAVRA
jgi:hypothetical protein